MSLPYEVEMSAVQWQDKEPVPKKNKEENPKDGEGAKDEEQHGDGPSDDEAAVEQQDRSDLDAVEREEEKTPAPPPKSKRDTSSRRSQRSNHTREGLRSRGKDSSTPRRRPQSQRTEKRLKPYNERKEAVSARRINAEKEKNEQEEAEEQAKEEKVVDSDDDETKKKKAAPEKAKNNIPLRKPQTVSTRATGDGTEPNDEREKTADSGDDGKNDEAGEKKQFPTRLWSKKKDYAGENERKQATANEQRREEFEKNSSPRIKQPRKEKEQGKIFFNQVHKAKEVWTQKLPDIIDFRYLPKKPDEKIEEITERLAKKREPKVTKPPPAPETLDEEGIEKLNGRLYKQKRRYDEEALERPKYKVIEPNVLEEEDIDRIVTKLYDTKSEAAERKRQKMAWHSHASEIPKLEPEAQKRVVSRLHDADHIAKREQKTLTKLGGIQGDGWSPERHHTSYRQEFDKKHNFSQ